jgi:hypothetical protein
LETVWISYPRSDPTADRITPFWMCCCLITWFMPSSRFALYFRRMTTMRSKWPTSAYASGTALLFGLASSAGLGDGFLMVRRVSCAHNMPAVASTAPSSLLMCLLVCLLVMVSILSCRSGTRVTRPEKLGWLCGSQATEHEAAA